MHWCPRLPSEPFTAAASCARWAFTCILGIAIHSLSAASPPGGIYLIGDAAEAIHLSDQPGSPGAHLLIAADASDVTEQDRPAGPAATVRGSKSSRLAGIVDQAARDHRIEPEFLRAIIDIESGSAVRAVSPKGAQGLMQLMPATALEYDVRDPFDPQQNVGAGAQHLRRLLDRFGQDKTLALAAYNAGSEAVVRNHGRIPPYAETMAYVPRVLQRFAALQRESPAAIPELRALR
jgi:hypothetical protein